MLSQKEKSFYEEASLLVQGDDIRAEACDGSYHFKIWVDKWYTCECIEYRNSSSNLIVGYTGVLREVSQTITITSSHFKKFSFYKKDLALMFYY